MDAGLLDLSISKCTKCRKEIGNHTSKVWLVGGWPFCSNNCLTTNEVRIAWSRMKHNQVVMQFENYKLEDFECISKEPYGGPVDE